MLDLIHIKLYSALQIRILRLPLSQKEKIWTGRQKDLNKNATPEFDLSKNNEIIVDMASNNYKTMQTKASSTRYRKNLKTKEYFYGYGFRPHVSGVFAHWKR